jgi:hypothetical protein
VLKEGEFERVGSSVTQKVDVRVIAASNRNLADAARVGTFRSDLYYGPESDPTPIRSCGIILATLRLSGQEPMTTRPDLE